MVQAIFNLGRETRIASYFLGLGTAGAIADYFSPQFELLAHFTLQYIIGAVALLGIAIWQKRKFFAFYCVIILLINVADVAYVFVCCAQPMSPQQRARTNTELRVLQFNQNIANSPSEDAIDQLKALAQEYDIIVFQEYNNAMDRLRQDVPSLLNAFPHLFRVSQGRNVFYEGLAVWSKLPLTSETLIFNANYVDQHIIRMYFVDKKIVMFAMHSYPPMEAHYVNARNAQQKWAMQQLANETCAAFLLGDFNQTPYATAFQQNSKETGVKIARFPYGIVPSWPRQLYLPMLEIPIDQLLANDATYIASREAISIAGSDHLAVGNRLQIDASDCKI
jgi:endonuclease/exonuclease/phosphatase (EEP) superfamily protein YafD